MKYWKIVSVIYLSVVGMPRPAPAQQPVKGAFDLAADAVVKLYGRRLGREHGYGTGFLVSSDGQILTVLSVLASGGHPKVVLADGRMLYAQLLRMDTDRQLALLKIDGKNLPHLEPATSDTIQIGDSVLALGNWFKIAEGKEPVSIIRGILSLKTDLHARRLTQEYEYRGPVLIYDAMTSNPGAAGGPLLDIEGHCIGMIGRVVESVNTNTRINYAIPSEEIRLFLDGQSAPHSPTPPTTTQSSGAQPYVGIKISKLGYRHVSAYIERVLPGSPAAKAGLQADDLIVAMDRYRIADSAAYRAAVPTMTPGQVVQFVVKRHNELITIPVIVGIKP